MRPECAGAASSSCQSRTSRGVGKHAGSDNYCRTCRAAYKQEHYEAHRERYIANAGHRKQALIAERTAYLIKFFRERPCADCGETDPLVLEFDHLGSKNFNISSGLRNNNWQAVLDEIAT